MRLACPCCGERGLEEFTYSGDASLRRPDGGAAAPVAPWADYVYLRDNTAGPHRELWYHGAGCRCWLVVTRDTRCHAVLDVALARDVSRAEAQEAEA